MKKLNEEASRDRDEMKVAGVITPRVKTAVAAADARKFSTLARFKELYGYDGREKNKNSEDAEYRPEDIDSLRVARAYCIATKSRGISSRW